MLDLHTLNPQQRQAVEAIRGPVLILAGAGTGKTRVITYRVAHLMERGVAPGNILAVTFTNKAAREMRERVSHLTPYLGRQADRPLIATFHSFCVRILRKHIGLLGYKPNFVIFSEGEQMSAIKKVMSHFSSKGQKPDPGDVLAAISRFKNGQAGKFSDESIAELAKHLLERYQASLKACNAVDFDDLILLVIKIFKQHPNVLEECRERYRFLMVDEYQDTNLLQFQLVHAIAEKHRNLCVVGDDDQSIYGWRGAEIANLLELDKWYPEVKTIKLEQNYRSTETILKAANAVIKNNVRRKGKQLWSKKGQGRKIGLSVCENDEEEGKQVVEQIQIARQGQRTPWADHAILFRTNGQARSIETALRKGSVPYHVIGGQSYFDRREIKDFLAYLRLFLNPNDDVSLLRIANVPARGLGDTTMEKLIGASHERHCSVFEVMKHTDLLSGVGEKTAACILRFMSWTQEVSESLQKQTAGSLSKWASEFITQCAYHDDLRKSEKTPEAGENRVRNLNELIALLDDKKNPTRPAQDRLFEFLEEITLDDDRKDEKEEERKDSVTLITVHSCKGLEYRYVYLVGVEKGLLPHSRSIEEGTLDEERRLFYVAITRAMESLSISYCLGRNKYGRISPCHPSPFLDELPPELLESVAARTMRRVTVDEGKSRFDSLRQMVDGKS